MMGIKVVINPICFVVDSIVFCGNRIIFTIINAGLFV